MTWNTLISDIYKKLGQEMASELYSDSDIITAINGSLDIIETDWTWSFNIWALTIPATTGNKSFPSLTQSIFKVYWVKWFEEATTPETDADILKQVPVISPTPDLMEFVSTYNGILTNKEYNKVLVFCNHWNKRLVNTESARNESIGLPSVLQNALRELALAFLYPTYIDTGYELAKYHRDIWMDLVARCHTVDKHHKTFTQVVPKYK